MTETRRAGVAEVEVNHDADLPPHPSAPQYRNARALKVSQPLGTVVRRTRTIDGEPFSFTINFLPPAVGALLSTAELKGEPVMWLLQAKGIVFVGAPSPSARSWPIMKVSRRLKVPLGAAVLFVERLVLAEQDRPVELVQSWYRGDRYEYTVMLDLDARSSQSLHAHFA